MLGAPFKSATQARWKRMAKLFDRNSQVRFHKPMLATVKVKMIVHAVMHALRSTYC
jgi:hypothetical protein